MTPSERTISIPSAVEGRKVWLRVGTLLDGTSATPLRNAHVVYDANGILFAGDPADSPPAHLLNPGQHEPNLDLSEFTLLPGLIEAHAHLFLEGGELNLDKRNAYLKQNPHALLQAAFTRMEKLAQFGIIGIRDAGDKDGVGLALSRLSRSRRREEADGSARPELRLLTSTLRSTATEDGSAATQIPYLDSPGAAIHHQGRYGSFMADPIEKHASLRACVESRVNAGADRIKLIPTGIINFKQGAVTTEPQMTAQEVTQLVSAARSLGRQTFAHASGDTGIEHAIEGGVDSIEHGFFIRPDQLAKMRDWQIAWVPTIAPVQKQVDRADLMGWDEAVVSNLKKILDQHAASLLKAHALGVQIIAGSDAGSVGVAHGLGFLYELELMERAGLASWAVINAATGTSSNRLAFKENFGQIKPGYQSRFILTRHSPLDSIRNLQKEKIVVFDGVVLEHGSPPDSAGL